MDRPICAVEALQCTPQQAAVCAPDPPVIPDGVAEPRSYTSFRFVCEVLDGGHVVKVRPMMVVEEEESAVTYAQALRLMQETEGNPFMDDFLSSLQTCRFPAFFFETPPVTSTTVNSRPFEYVLVDSPALARISDQPDKAAFADKLGEAERQGGWGDSFRSLSGDAMLVCPCHRTAEAEESAYTHIANFARGAPKEQQLSVWARAASIIEDSFKYDPQGAQPFWLSTSGLGVYWVHVRVDTRPKYYTWPEYKLPPPKL